MRRVLAGVSNFTDVGDTGTLANAEIVDSIRKQIQAAKLESGETPPNSPRSRSPRSRLSDRPSRRAVAIVHG